MTSVKDHMAYNKCTYDVYVVWTFNVRFIKVVGTLKRYTKW